MDNGHQIAFDKCSGTSNFTFNGSDSKLWYTDHGNDYLGQKNIGPKVHIVTTWESIKKIKKQHSFRR